jgi:hypothetical protein
MNHPPLFVRALMYVGAVIGLALIAQYMAACVDATGPYERECVSSFTDSFTMYSADGPDIPVRVEYCILEPIVPTGGLP